MTCGSTTFWSRLPTARFSSSSIRSPTRTTSGRSSARRRLSGRSGWSPRIAIRHPSFWRIGLTGDADTDLKDALGPARVALVLGAEGPGLRHNTREHCDALARLPIGEAVESLNVSNAAAVALYAASTR